MVLTVGQVAALPDLGLVVRTLAPSLDREVRWVAVSELVDPTPWLEGGDLLLTTGMSIVDDRDLATEYVDRLMRAEVAALGFGVGLTHQFVPVEIVAAAERAGLPVLEVPQPVPFVALSKAVSRRLSAEEYAESAASFDCQRRLIRAALGGGARGPADLVSVLGPHLDGFALHLDVNGAVVAAGPAGAAARAPDLAPELARLRPGGLLASASMSTASEHVVIVPIGVRGTADGFLVAGSPRPLRSADQAALNLAVSLLSWEASRPVATDEGMDPWRGLLISVAAERGLDGETLERVGVGGLDARRAVAISVRSSAGRSVPDVVLSAANARGASILCRRPDGDLEGYASIDEVGAVPPDLALLASYPGVESVGVSCPRPDRPANVRQALEQAEDVRAQRVPAVHLRSPTIPRLASLINAATTATWARAASATCCRSPRAPT